MIFTRINTTIYTSLISTALLLILASPASAIKRIAQDPYHSAIVINADNGQVLFNDKGESVGYPASMVKLMTLLIILDGIEKKLITLDDKITVLAKAANTGGSQVYLKEGEVFTVDEMLYALIIKSANDVAVALAQFYASSTDTFVMLMNKKAKELGMNNTVFHSVHGLPPKRGKKADSSTAHDIAILSQAVLKYPQTLKYTACKVRNFRPDSPKPFVMRTHNNLLKNFPGCDGLKTGFFWAAGFSVAATAEKYGHRAIVVIMGSSYQKVRDQQAKKLLSTEIMNLALEPPPPPPEEPKEKEPEVVTITVTKTTFKTFCFILFALSQVLAFRYYLARKRSGKQWWFSKNNT